jgi:hypothetical protein
MISLKGCARNGSFKSVDLVTTESNAEATATSRNGVNLVGETFVADIAVPEAIGKTMRTVQMVRKRDCDNVNKDVSETQEKPASYLVGPISITAKVDPNNPNVIRGTQKDGDTEISYSFSRCGAPDIKLSDLALEEHQYPDAQAWHDAGREIVDGNLVRIKAKVRNDGSAPGYATVKIHRNERKHRTARISFGFSPAGRRTRNRIRVGHFRFRVEQRRQDEITASD